MPHFQDLNQDQRQIRLVRFSTAPRNSHTKLQSKTVSLHKRPSYHAVSYVWGDPTPKFPITINDEPFVIAETLHLGLKQLFGVLPADTWLWIDAVCINQHDVSERNSQVGQMRDIFEAAELVWICLGDSNHDVDCLLDAVSSLGQEALSAGVLELWTRFSYHGSGKVFMPDDVAEYPALSFLPKVLQCTTLRNPRIMKAIEDVLSRSNWSRVWITQEVTLAAKGEVLCGEKHVDLDKFHAVLTAIYFAKISGFARRHPQWEDFGSGLRNNYFHIHGLLCRLSHLRGQEPRLLELLLSDMMVAAEDRPFYGASDPRDIIFSLLGIAADVKLLRIQPDYYKSVQYVYTEATRAMMLQCPDYRLEYSYFPKDTPDLPSWVPDWQQIGHFGVAHPLSYGDHFHASLGRTQPLRATGDHATLKRKAIIIDSVIDVFEFQIADSHDYSTSASMNLASALFSKTKRTDCLRSILNFAEPHFKDQTGELNLWRVMLGNLITYVGGDSSNFNIIAPRAFREEAVTAEDIDESLLEHILQYAKPRPYKLKEGEEVQTLVDKFYTKVMHCAAAAARRRTLFVTLHGAFGLGPYMIRQGDAVTVLFGTQVPIILRPAGAAYTYIGAACVDGVMQGECMTGQYEEHDVDII